MTATISPTGKRPYHHGDLRKALQTAASELIRQRGAEAVSLREISQVAGVSHAAAYRHYADKQALLADLAEAGFHELAQLNRSSIEACTAGPLAQLMASGRAYVRFGARQPHLLQLMFGGAISDWQSHPALVQAGAALAQALTDLIVAGQACGEMRAGDPADLTLTAWSLVHGLALLVIGKRIPGAVGDEEALIDQIAQRCVALLAQGLGTPAGVAALA
ncbi:MAG: TetR/AcrR family transcriptional regulator [Rhodoferax sp.]|nr:TetR/AcrR family transcriptional regulator [Rhodoferax sp.]MDP3653032.1 TetR/AcrR family transcriptional regulator [Rhodoferax sp.]